MSQSVTPDWVFDMNDESQGIFRQLTEGLHTRIFCGDNVMLSFVRIKPNSQVVVHSHAEEQWGILLEGECVRIQGDDEVPVKIGDFWQTPGNVSHGIRTGDVGALVVDIFSPPRAEYRQTGAGFGANAE